MPRTPDTQRILKLLQDEGGTLGKREIIEALGLSADRYAIVAKELVADRKALSNRGRAGGLQLPQEASNNRPEPKSTAGTNGDDARKVARPSLEAELYPPLSRYLERAAKDNDQSRSVILPSYRTKMGKWESPDLAEVRVTPFPMIGQWELKVATYEVKRQGAWSVESVLQTATYAEFAHESWLVIPAGDVDDWVEHFGNRVVDKAGDFGIGLATFDVTAGTLKKHMKPRRQLPSMTRLHEWLEGLIDNLGDSKVRETIGNNVRWGRGKAEAGRD